MGRRWTEEEEKKAKELLIQGNSYEEVSKILNRNVNNIRKKNKKNGKSHI